MYIMDAVLSNRSTTAEAASWGDAIRQLEAEKKTLPWNIADSTTKVKRINLRERRLQERELDPIVMKFRDAASEQNFTDTLNSKMETVLARSASISSKYNIINHQGSVKSLGGVIRRDPTASMNIVSNLNGKDHYNTPLLYSDSYTRTRFVPKRKEESKNKIIPSRRDFNIVSNNFYLDNEAKQLAEYETLHDEVTKRYWETHGYNPVMGQYYSEADEQRYVEQREMLKTVQGKSQACRIPPRLVMCKEFLTIFYVT